MAELPSCSYRIATQQRNRFTCLHSRVRAHNNIVTADTCYHCQLYATQDVPQTITAIPVENGQSNVTQVANAALKRISFCVSLKNRADNFLQMLSAWQRVTKHDESELIVADFGSNDLDLDAVLRATARAVRIVRLPLPFNRARGLNAAARAATGQFLFFLDADVILSNDICSRIRANAKARQAYFPICYSLREGSKCLVSEPGWWRAEGYGMCGFHAGDLLRIGGWREAFKRWGGEDAELHQRAQLSLQVIRERCPGLFHLWHPNELAYKERYHSLPRRSSTKPVQRAPHSAGGQAKPGDTSQKTKSPANNVPLRVGFLTPSFRLGGAERWMVALARECDPQQVRWTGTALTEWAQSDTWLCREMCRYMPIYAGLPRGNGIHDFCYVERVGTSRDAINRVSNEADILITWGIHNLKATLTQQPPAVILVAHGTGETTRRAMQSSESGATHFVAVSEAARATFRPDLRWNVAVLHNGIDVARCQPSRAREGLRSRFGIAPTAKLIGYIGRLSPEKNPLAAAKAAQFLGGSFRALYVSSGTDEAAEAAIQAAAGGQAIFIPPSDQVGDALALIDVFMLASPNEGFSLGLTEAWLQSVPAVATRVGAVPELEEEFGRLVTPVRVDATAEELGRAVRLALSPANQKTIDRARRMVQQHFTSTAMASRWTSFLREIMSNVAGER